MVIDRRICTSIKRSPLQIALALSLLMNATVGPTLASSQSNGFLCPSFGKLAIGSQSQDNSSQLVAMSLSKQSASMQMPAFGKLDAGGTPTPSALQAPTSVAPAEIAPAETTSADATPADTTPVILTPADTAAANVAPADTASVNNAPAETTSTNAAPAETASTNASTDTASANATPVETAPANVAPATTPDLTPVSITSDTNQSAPAATTGSEGGNAEMLKTSVTRNELAPKGPVEDDPALASQSVISKKSAGDKLKKGKEDIAEEARKVNAMPLPLQTTDDEQKDTDKKKYTAEQQEMSDLWDAALGRNQDIQFVIQKLMPSNNDGKTGFILSKLISTAMLGGASAAMMMAPNMGTQMGMNAGTSMMYQALNGVQSNKAKRQRLAESEQIMLYNLVRATADKMVENFRNYKKNVSQLKTATSDLEDLKNMVKDASGGVGAPIEMEYTLRKQQRDIDGITDDARKYRQALVDLAGPDAVARLDNQLANEGIGSDLAATPVVPSPGPSATPPAQPTDAAQTPAAQTTTAQAPTPAPPAGPAPAQKKKATPKAATKTAAKPATPAGNKKAQKASTSQIGSASKASTNPQIGSAPNGATQ